jgi:tetratricopeptide (TPR) repeat protein
MPAGEGGMGRVYRCIDRTNGKRVALKVMSVSGDDHLQRFAREVRVLAQLKHRAIVRYVDHGTLSAKIPYLAMEWVEGESLEGMPQAAPLSVRQTLSLGHRLCEALSEAHMLGVVHRDIKPGNILLDHGNLEAAKLLDFGLARDFDTEHQVTATGVLLGTPAYMAPEQARQASELDARCDVFALGCVLYECLAGRRAFQGPNMISVLCKVMLEDPPPLLEVRPSIPRAVSDLIACMMAKAPEARPENAGAALTLINEVRDRQGASDIAPRMLGRHEQRFFSLILAGWPDPDEIGSMPTVAASARNLAAMRRAIDGLASRVERMVNGSLVVSIDRGGTAADRAERAARCALEMRQSMPNVPVVLATGRGFLNSKLPLGDVIDVAAALLASAQAGARADGGLPILIDPVSASLLRARFDIDDESGHFALRGPSNRTIEPRKLLGRKTECVGRKSELATLQAVWEECVEEQVPAGILITGSPGIGKSRVAAEFLTRLSEREAPPRVLTIRGDPLGVGGAFGLLGRLVALAMGIREDDSPVAARKKLDADVAARFPRQEVERVAHFLSDMIGLQQSSGTGAFSEQVRAAQLDPALKSDQIRRAFSEWMRAECEVRPVVIAMEDLQWADTPSLEMLHGLLGSSLDAPLMVIGLARPEIEQRTPSVWSDRGVTTMRLGPLRKKIALNFVRNFLPDIDEPAAVRLVDLSGGNPFFLEELIRARASGRESGTPETVLAVLQTSLDELTSSHRMVLRAASVFGETFWQGALRPLLGQDVENLPELMSELVEREILVLRSKDRFADEEEFGFAQGLWRDAAYATLTDDDRRLGHALAAEWLAERAPGAPYTIALHYTHAARPEHASAWYARAARLSLEGFDHGAALARVALALPHASGVEQGALLAIKAEAHKWRGENSHAEEAALGALELLPGGQAVWFLAVGEAAAAAGKLGHANTLSVLGAKLAVQPALDEAARAARVIAGARTVSQLVLAGELQAADDILELIDAAEAEPVVAGWVFEARAIRAGSANDVAGRVRLAQQAAAAFERGGDLRNACLQLTSAGFAFNEIGDYGAARDALTQAIELGEKLRLANAVATARAQLGRALSRLGDYPLAERTLDSAIIALNEQGNARLAGVATSYLAWLSMQTGRFDDAERQAREAACALETALPLKAGADATLARILLSRGEAAEAAKIAASAAATLDRVGHVPTGEGMVRLSFAEALLALGRNAEAKRVATVAKGRLLERAKLIDDIGLRDAFLSIAEHARTLQLAGGE